MVAVRRRRRRLRAARTSLMRAVQARCTTPCALQQKPLIRLPSSLPLPRPPRESHLLSAGHLSHSVSLHGQWPPPYLLALYQSSNRLSGPSRTEQRGATTPDSGDSHPRFSRPRFTLGNGFRWPPFRPHCPALPCLLLPLPLPSIGHVAYKPILRTPYGLRHGPQCTCLRRLCMQ